MPLVGRIAAGIPILAEQQVEDIFPLPRQLVGEGTLFMLKVAGDSMINAAIADGDWVVVRQQEDAENGEIVAAMIDGEATVKTLKQSDGHVWLMPHNPALHADPRRRRHHPRQSGASAVLRRRMSHGSEQITDRRVSPGDDVDQFRGRHDHPLDLQSGQRARHALRGQRQVAQLILR